LPWNPETGEQTHFETRGLRLRQIAEMLCEPFGIGVRLDARASAALGQPTPSPRDLDRVFPKVKLEPGGKIWDFLTSLAKQIGLVLADDAEGNLLLRKSVPVGGALPVAKLEEGRPPLMSVTPTFRPQDYFSDVTVIAKKTRQHGASRWTAINPFLRSIVRPMTTTCDDIAQADVKATAEDQLARMLAKCASWDVELPTAVDPQGNLYQPNTLVQLRAPGAMIFGFHDFLIRSVVMREDKDGTTCKLGLVLPGAFTGQMPPLLPWSEVA
jgi:prophage tail gpP-like protein